MLERGLWPAEILERPLARPLSEHVTGLLQAKARAP